MRRSEEVEITRDVEAVVIPAGNRILIPEGVTVTITQSLGGSYTVITPQGYMARVDGRDADALGLEPAPAPAAAPSKPVGSGNGSVPAAVDTAEIEKAVWDELRTIFDPEIPVNVVDLGLIYECKVHAGERGAEVEVAMTMTAPGCGMGDVLRGEAEDKIRRLPGVEDVRVDIVWDPPWDMSRMSEAARLELGFG
jgi:probable FeS assembly SUF system protein SufT